MYLVSYRFPFLAENSPQICIVSHFSPKTRLAENSPRRKLAKNSPRIASFSKNWSRPPLGLPRLVFNAICRTAPATQPLVCSPVCIPEYQVLAGQDQGGSPHLLQSVEERRLPLAQLLGQVLIQVHFSTIQVQSQRTSQIQFSTCLLQARYGTPGYSPPHQLYKCTLQMYIT